MDREESISPLVVVVVVVADPVVGFGPVIGSGTIMMNCKIGETHKKAIVDLNHRNTTTHINIYNTVLSEDP